ncbi:MAG: AraC family transcriptional regulator [Bifidobacteriaceae bacterium]|jgi:AraC-like DNA-binding protein|nr:AraC family transcriptional regulator [Bifidobacteriaceae bacterium]
MTKREGFVGQQMQVLPGPRIAQASTHPVLGRLLVTDCGYFPTAAQHYRSRPGGTTAAVIMVCTNGSGFVDLYRGRRRVEAGQAVVVPPGVPHRYGADRDTPWTIWWMHLAGEDVPGLVSVVTGPGAEPVVPVAGPDRIADLIAEALGHMERADTDLELIGAAGAAWHAMTVLATGKVSAGSRDPIRATLRFLQDHIGQRHAVADLAARVNLSPSHFAALFRRSTGLSVNRYQIRLAMNRARVLLDGTDLPVASIAVRAGFSDPFYFSRQFRAIHGLTPSQFRAGHKG